VDLGILKLVFFFGVEDEAVLVQEAHDRRLPTRTPQEVYYDIEKPILRE
jgi:hypothetical protein